MKRFLTGTAVVLAASLASFAGCASQLKPYKTINTPDGTGVEEELDLTQIFFTDLYSGAKFSVAEYMQADGKDHLLLMFGSKGCTSCNQKNEHFKQSIIGQHALFLTDEGHKFDIIGVNTDVEPAERMRTYLTQFDFIKWSDPRGLNMIAHFVPPGRSFGVPVTVLLSKRGIVFRILNDEKATPEEIMARVEAAILKGGVSDDGSDDGGDDGTVKPPKPPKPPTPPVVPATDLAFIGPGRFKKVEVTPCSGSPVALDTVLGQPDFRIVQATKGACTDACKANLTQLKALAADLCAEAGSAEGSKKCAVAAVQTEAPTAASAACASGLAYGGGQKFFEVFGSHFRWDDAMRLDDDDFYARFESDLAGPLTMVFRRDGALVWSHEGSLAPGMLSTALAAPGFGSAFASGPGFSVYTKDEGQSTLADTLKKAKITVLSTSQIVYNPPCGGCLEELQKWSQPGNLVDYCAARPSECQVRFIETRDKTPWASDAAFYDFAMNGGNEPDVDPPLAVVGLNERGVRVPLLVDTEAKYTAEGDNLRRIHEGYLTAASRSFFAGPELGNPLITIFNQEGRIVEMYLSGDPDHAADFIFERVKSLTVGQQ